MTWDGVLRLPGAPLSALATRYGGRLAEPPGDGLSRPALAALTSIARILPVEDAGAGDLAPLLASRFVRAARAAAARGAFLLVDASLEGALRAPASNHDASAPARIWVHDHATRALASLLSDAIVPDVPAVVGPGCSIAPSAVLGPRVVLGARVVVGPGAVIGYPGFGWASGGPEADARAIPQLAGVVIGDDVAIGPLTTVDAGTLAPTRIGSGVKLDAHVHVGHNVVIGEGTIVAAQCGFAGSVRIGRGVLVGGQVGIADHIVVGDGARIAAKSGVIGDVPAGATVAGYPAVPRVRWLRGLATLYGRLRPDGDS